MNGMHGGFPFQRIGQNCPTCFNVNGASTRFAFIATPDPARACDSYFVDVLRMYAMTLHISSADRFDELPGPKSSISVSGLPLSVMKKSCPSDLPFRKPGAENATGLMSSVPAVSD